MEKRNKIGSALVDYVVPTALVGLVVGLGMFSMYKSGVLTKFFAASSGMELNGTSASIGEVKDSSGLVSASSGGGGETGSTTPTEPLGDATISCTGDNCAIDLGDYVLDGIPENFAEYIESSGNSGGTDMLANLIKQLADESDLPEDQKDLIRELANFGHDIALNERQIESVANDYSNGVAVPDNVEDYINNLDPSITGSARSEFGSTLESVLGTLESSTSPDALMIKELINVLGGEIDAMATEMLIDSTKISIGTELNEKHATSSADAILNPDTSKRTDLDSAMICATGNGRDQGYSCN